MPYGIRKSGRFVGPRFARYVDAFNYRAANVPGGVIQELEPSEREQAAELLDALRDPNSEGPRF